MRQRITHPPGIRRGLQYPVNLMTHYESPFQRGGRVMPDTSGRGYFMTYADARKTGFFMILDGTMGGGSFHGGLAKLFKCADLMNLRRLRDGFPYEAEIFDAWRRGK